MSDLHQLLSDGTGGDGVSGWTSDQSVEWARRQHLNAVVCDCVRDEQLDGRCLLSLAERDIRDLRDTYGYALKVSDIKRFWVAVRALQRDNIASLVSMGLEPLEQPQPPTTTTTTTEQSSASSSALLDGRMAAGSGSRCMSTSSGSCCATAMLTAAATAQHALACDSHHHHHHLYGGQPQHHHHHHHNSQDIERISPPMSVDGRATSIQPEYFKTFIGLGEWRRRFALRSES